MACVTVCFGNVSSGTARSRCKTSVTATVPRQPEHARRDVVTTAYQTSRPTIAVIGSGSSGCYMAQFPRKDLRKPRPPSSKRCPCPRVGALRRCCQSPGTNGGREAVRSHVRAKCDQRRPYAHWSLWPLVNAFTSWSTVSSGWRQLKYVVRETH